MESASLLYREATSADVPDMVQARASDLEAGPADARMARYLEGEHHPQKALAPRIAFVALKGGSMVGYIGGHLTRRYDCDGELQYLYVVPEERRAGVASELLRLLARWFAEHDASQVCVGVDEDNAGARSFCAHHGAMDLELAFLAWSKIQDVLA